MTSVVLMSFGPLSKWQYPCCLMDHKIKYGGQISMNIVYEKQKLNPRMRVRQQLKAKVIYINTKNWSPKAIVNKKPRK